MTGDAAPSGSRPATWPSAATRPVVLLGWPARHSRSPAIHNAAFGALGLDLVYLALPVAPEHLGTVVAALAAVEAVGANVTVPHKEAVVAHCDRLSEEARLVGAVNTLVLGDDGVLGDNTDAVGLADAVVAEGAAEPGTWWTVLGTGGAARAVAVAAGRLGCPLHVVGRRSEAAAGIAALARQAGAPAADAVDLADLAAVAAVVADARTVLNATPAGMAGERLVEPFHGLRPDQWAYDLVYAPPDTPFLRDARAAGAGASNGIGMLVGQAAASFERWTGRPAPLATMRAAALGM